MDEWLLYFSFIAPYTPIPRVQQIENYTPAYLTNLHKKYKRTKNILLLISLPEVAVYFLFIIFHCRHMDLYLYTYYSVPLVPYCKYLFKLVTGTIL